jgi:hypothetical protein
MRKNSSPLKPIHCQKKLEEVERKPPVVLVKPDYHWRSPTSSTEFV